MALTSLSEARTRLRQPGILDHQKGCRKVLERQRKQDHETGEGDEIVFIRRCIGPYHKVADFIDISEYDVTACRERGTWSWCNLIIDCDEVGSLHERGQHKAICVSESCLRQKRSVLVLTCIFLISMSVQVHIATRIAATATGGRVFTTNPISHITLYERKVIHRRNA